MVPVTADAAELCLYRASSDRSPKEVLGRVVILGRARTRTLTQLLKMGRARRGSACIADPTVFWLRLPRGAARRYVVGGCHPAVLVGARGSSPLRGWVADALSGLGDLFVDAGKARAPDLVGLPLGQAIRAAKRARATVVIAHELYAPARLGTVVWQDPLPGAREDADVVQAELLVAATRARTCRTEDLAGRYREGGRGTGQQFGGAIVANTSSQPCALHGRLHLRGLASDGHAVTATISQPLEDPLILSPRSTPRSVPPRLVVTFSFFGDVRDDPSARDGLCYDHETIPASWEVTLSTGAHIRFANGNGQLTDSFATCHGDLHFDTQLNSIGPTGVQLVSP
jgi:hypothetical protein